MAEAPVQHRDDQNRDRGPVLAPRNGDLAPEDAPHPLWRVRRTLLVDVELVVTAPDAETARAVSDLVLEDISLQADCARLLRVRGHGDPIVEAGGSDMAPAIGRPLAVARA